MHKKLESPITRVKIISGEYLSEKIKIVYFIYT